METTLSVTTDETIEIDVDCGIWDNGNLVPFAAELTQFQVIALDTSTGGTETILDAHFDPDSEAIFALTIPTTPLAAGQYELTVSLIGGTETFVIHATGSYVNTVNLEVLTGSIDEESSSVELLEDLVSEVGVPISLQAVVVDIAGYSVIASDPTFQAIASDSSETIAVEVIENTLDGTYELQFTISSTSVSTLTVEVYMDVLSDDTFELFGSVSLAFNTEGCNISQDGIDTLRESVKEVYVTPIILTATQGAKSDSFLLADMSDFVETLLSNSTTSSECASVKLVTTEAFLTYDDAAFTVYLEPSVEDQPGTYSDSYLQLTINDFPDDTFEVAIDVEISSCVVQSVEFETQSLALEYTLGSDPLEEPLPALIQTPDCGLPLGSSFSVEFVGSEEAVKALAFDQEKKIITIVSTDEALVGQNLQATIKISDTGTESLAVRELLVEVNFIVKGDLEFDMSKVDIQPLSCGRDDASWSLSLPPIADADSQKVSIELISVSEKDLFYLDGETILLTLDNRNSLLKGESCPNKDVILEFKLKSDTRGTSIVKIVVGVDNQNANEVTVDTLTSGGAPSTTAPTKKPEALKMKKLKFNSLGDLTITFNKDVLWPKLRTTGGRSSSKRALAGSDGYSIDELLSVKVTDANDDSSLNKKVSLKLKSYNAR